MQRDIAHGYGKAGVALEVGSSYLFEGWQRTAQVVSVGERQAQQAWQSAATRLSSSRSVVIVRAKLCGLEVKSGSRCT